MAITAETICVLILLAGLGTLAGGIIGLDGTGAYLITREEVSDGNFTQYSIPLPEDLSTAVHELASEN